MPYYSFARFNEWFWKIGMDKRAPLHANRVGAGIALSLLLVVGGLARLMGSWALACGTLLLVFAAWMVSMLWKPLPKSYWWFCVLASCLGVVGLFILKSASA
jgi:hypothetical protein